MQFLQFAPCEPRLNRPSLPAAKRTRKSGLLKVNWSVCLSSDVYLANSGRARERRVQVCDVYEIKYYEHVSLEMIHTIQMPLIKPP